MSTFRQLRSLCYSITVPITHHLDLLLCAILTSCPHFTESPEQMFAKYVSAEPRRSPKCTLLHAATLHLFGLDFSIPLMLERCAHGLVIFRHKKHFVGLRKTSWFGWKKKKRKNFRLFATITDGDGSHFSWKNSWLPQKQVEMSPGVLKKFRCCDSNCGRLFGSLIG